MLARIRDVMIKQEILHRGDRIVTGVSGGADSVCLLCVLAELREEFGLELYAVHVHHGIRGEEADRDAAFTEDLCRKLKVECQVVYRNVPELAVREKCSEEEMGRKTRYQVLEEYRQQHDCDWIAVAHNREDNAETILWNLCRGSGLTGLTGIRMVRGHIIRPLLFCSRSEIESWLAERGQDYCIDRTNLEETYTRNKIRHQVLPVLTESVNRQSVLHLTEMAERLSVMQGYLERQVEKELTTVCREQAAADGAEDQPMVRVCWREQDFRRCDRALQPEVLLQLLQQVSGHAQDFTAEHVRAVVELYDREAGKEIHLPYGLIARRTYTGVCLEHGQKKNKPASEKVYPLLTGEIENCESINSETVSCEVVITEAARCFRAEIWDCCQKGKRRIEKVSGGKILFSNGEIVKIPESSCTKWFDYDKICGTVVVRTRRPGDKLVIHPDGQKKKLKDYWIDQKVPREERDRIWLLAAGSDILWIPGDRTGENCRIDTGTRRILAVQIKDSNDEVVRTAE